MQVSVCSSICPSIHLSIRQYLPRVSCEQNSSYSNCFVLIVLIVLKLCMCFLHDMRICMWFGYNCYIIFCHFFHIVNLLIFHPHYIDRGTSCERNSYSFAAIVLKLCVCFLHGVKICMWFGYNC